MGIIAALLMFNCNLHFNQLGCVETHLSCIKMMSTIKIGGTHCLNYEQRLAASYLYCVETGGAVRGNTDYSDYLDMVDSLSNPYSDSEFNLWEKPGYWSNLKKQIGPIQAQE